MKTGLTKRHKTTHIFFDEQISIIEVQTYNTDLKNRLTKHAADYPDLCSRFNSEWRAGEIPEGGHGIQTV
jgi:hypothetical protein